MDVRVQVKPNGKFKSCAGVGGALWRQGFAVEHELRPPIVSAALAHKLLRAGKSLNFLR
jgi:hypothetical protein